MASFFLLLKVTITYHNIPLANMDFETTMNDSDNKNDEEYSGSGQDYDSDDNIVYISVGSVVAVLIVLTLLITVIILCVLGKRYWKSKNISTYQERCN